MSNQFKAVANTPINRAIFALNFYISTGDFIGEGVALEQGSHTLLLVLHNPREWEDKDNWERLQARLLVLERERLLVGVRHLGWSPGVNGPQTFQTNAILVETKHLDDFARAVREKPGPRGWGSLYTFLERHNLLDKEVPPSPEPEGAGL